MLKAVGKTDIGNIREINQDDFNCGVLGDDAVFAVVDNGDAASCFRQIEPKCLRTFFYLLVHLILKIL